MSDTEKDEFHSSQVLQQMAQKDADVLKLAQEIVALVQRCGSESYARDACKIAAVLCSPGYVYEGGN
jgi:hypothetical protein